MDGNRFWDSPFWDRVKKLSALASIVAAVVAIAWFGYTIWRDRSARPPSPGQQGGSIVNLWTPTYVIGSALLLTAILHLFAAFMSGRRSKKRKTEIEIVSPFDGEQVNLYETVRGRVSPPDSALQVLVFAGDKKWYPQPPVNVKGSTWSVKCQFGNTESPGGGAYKIVAIFGNELEQGMWYANLPSGVKSNIVHLSKREVTTEQKLSAALMEAKEANLRANDQEGQKDGLYKLYRESERQLANLTWLKQLAEEQAKDISEHVVIISRPPGSLILSKSPRVITVGLKIRNESIFDITIDPKEVKGHLFFAGIALDEAATQLIDESRRPITSLRPKQTALFVLKQPLLKSESETIAECENGDTQFWLGNLSIPISVLGDFNVATRPLRIHSEIEYVPLKDFGNTNNA